MIARRQSAFALIAGVKISSILRTLEQYISADDHLSHRLVQPLKDMDLKCDHLQRLFEENGRKVEEDVRRSDQDHRTEVKRVGATYESFLEHLISLIRGKGVNIILLLSSMDSKSRDFAQLNVNNIPASLSLPP